MIDKKTARRLYKSVRNSLSYNEKTEFDIRIYTRFINSDFFKRYDLFLVYVSVGSEVDTMNIIRYLLNNNKRVAVPVCNQKEMIFFDINSLDELCEGQFGIPAANEKIALKTVFSDKTLCIVPGICFDLYGNRIGYGGGYYDRFLSENFVDTLGLCYERCICKCIPCEYTDRPVDFILTERSLRNSKFKEVSTYE